MRLSLQNKGEENGKSIKKHETKSIILKIIKWNNIFLVPGSDSK